MLSNQEMFDKVVFGLRKQGSGALGPSNSPASEAKDYTGPKEDTYKRCLYRGGFGTRCGIGMLIADEDYHPKMEGLSVFNLIAQFRYAIDFDCGSSTTLNLAVRLQQVHDVYKMFEWEVQFANIAKEYDLIYTPPEQASTETK